jgi:hypothetical protein
MDHHIIWAWVFLGGIILMSCHAHLYGRTEHTRTRGAKMLWPLVMVGTILAFATPTGYWM